MSKTKLFLSYVLTIGALSIICTIVILAASWIVQNSGNFLLAYFESTSQLKFIDILTVVTIIVIAIIGISFLTGSSHKNVPQSKAMKYEEDLRWFNDYVGDDYY